MTIKTLAIPLSEHPCIMNIFLGPVTVHYREVLLYKQKLLLQIFDIKMFSIVDVSMKKLMQLAIHFSCAIAIKLFLSYNIPFARCLRLKYVFL